MMKRLVVHLLCAASAVLLLVSCATMRIDGNAVDCSRCRTMWIYLFADSPAPGLYRLDERENRQRSCLRCQEIAVRFFESGILLRRCPDCGGYLQPRKVNVAR